MRGEAQAICICKPGKLSLKSMARGRKHGTEIGDAPFPTDQLGVHCVAHRVRMLSRSVTTLYTRSLASVGLKASQLNVLSAVHLLDAPTATDLVPFLRMDKSTVSRHLSWLVAHGLVRVDGNDGRRRITLTAAGRRRLERAEVAWVLAQREATARLGDDGMAALELIVERLADCADPRVPGKRHR